MAEAGDGAGGATAAVADPPDVFLSDLNIEHEPVRGMSLWSRIKLSYIDMRRTTRVLLDERPSEARLLFFVLLSDVVFFLSRGVALVIAPGSPAHNILPENIGIWLIIVFLGRTLTLYAFSALVAIVCRAFGGQGGWRETRTGVFWASLVAAPIGVAGALVVAAFSHLEPFLPIFGEPMVALPPQWIGIVAFVFFLSAGVAEAQRFRHTSPVFIVFSVLTVFLSLAGIYIYVNNF